MRKGTATILLKNEEALRVAASAARISTQQGTALEIFEKSGDREKDLKLLGKVLSSGHKSVIEHQSFGVAFNDVSVLAEQFCIEFRLASFTVKSRRYVDFSGAGYVVPEGMTGLNTQHLYEDGCQKLFRVYEQLLELGIPREDARFVLPYGFRSNFYMTINARELINMIGAMLAGRGSAWPELRYLGEQLKAQFDALYPGVLDAELAKRPPERPVRTRKPHGRVEERILVEPAEAPRVEIVSAPSNPLALLEAAADFSGRYGADELRALLGDARPRELEFLNYAFRIDNISLACLTHFTRHRMLSLLTEHVQNALMDGYYVLPASIARNPEARNLYENAFYDQQARMRLAFGEGATAEELAYFAMAGNTTSILISMNARELLHFAQLRCCNRAQWEIRGIAREMVRQLNVTDARSLFQFYGPTCAVTGKCPEGKMSCGHPVRIVDGEWIEE